MSSTLNQISNKYSNNGYLFAYLFTCEGNQYPKPPGHEEIFEWTILMMSVKKKPSLGKEEDETNESSLLQAQLFNQLCMHPSEIALIIIISILLILSEK
jgi:hypothetical protein